MKIFSRSVTFHITNKDFMLRWHLGRRSSVPLQLRKGWIKHIRKMEIHQEVLRSFSKNFETVFDEDEDDWPFVYPATPYLSSLQDIHIKARVELLHDDIT